MFSREKKLLNAQELSDNLKTILSKSGTNLEESDNDDDDDDDDQSQTIAQMEQMEDEYSDEEEEEEVLPESFIESDTDRCIIVGFVDRWYPGYITSVINSDTAKVNFLHPTVQDLNCSTFKWPRPKDEMEINMKAVISMNADLSPQGSLRLWDLSGVKRINFAFRN